MYLNVLGGVKVEDLRTQPVFRTFFRDFKNSFWSVLGVSESEDLRTPSAFREFFWTGCPA